MKIILLVLLAVGAYTIWTYFSAQTQTVVQETTTTQEMREDVSGLLGSSLKKAGDIKDVLEQKSGAVLDFSGQGLTKVPADIFEQELLVELNLSNNELEGSLPTEVRHLQGLRVLNLSNNNFTAVPEEIGQLTNLEVLDLSHNRLTGLPYELGNLSNLKTLDVSGNSYTEADLEIIRRHLPAHTVIKTE